MLRLVVIVTVVVILLAGLADWGPLFLSAEEMRIVHDVGRSATVIWIALLSLAILRFFVEKLYNLVNRR